MHCGAVVSFNQPQTIAILL